MLSLPHPPSLEGGDRVVVGLIFNFKDIICKINKTIYFVLFANSNFFIHQTAKIDTKSILIKI